jgi:hypothetical protein
VTDPQFFIGSDDTQLFLTTLMEGGEVGDLFELHTGRLKIGASWCSTQSCEFCVC